MPRHKSRLPKEAARDRLQSSAVQCNPVGAMAATFPVPKGCISICSAPREPNQAQDPLTQSVVTSALTLTARRSRHAPTSGVLDHLPTSSLVTPT